MASKADRLFYLACAIAVSALASLSATPAHADFFDDMRRTFQTDIPHFFQDDIPCAFGGQPTSGAKKACKSSDHPAKPAPEKGGDQPPAPNDKPNDPGNAPPSSGY
jgi:hypothetical protein